MIKFLKQKASLLLIFLEISLSILGILSLTDDVSFMITKKEANAEVIKIQSLSLPKPYKVTLKYYNEYVNESIISYIDNIDGIYGGKLPKATGHVTIYYRKYFPKEIYLADYHVPGIGYIILNIVFLVIMFIAIYFQASKLRTPVSVG